MSVQLLAFVPVLHRGYDQVLGTLGPGDEVLLLGESFAAEHPVVRKEIRALAPERAAEYLRGLRPDLTVRVVEVADLPEAVVADTLLVPDEQLLRDVVDGYDLGSRAQVRWERTFLRWDRSRAESADLAERFAVPADPADAARFAKVADELAEHSADWWRQVGALAVRDGEVLAAERNRHLPTEYSPYVDGDPRNEYSKGVRTDLTTALHAEAAVIADAARRGVSLAGADLYVSTFPCPTCTRLIIAAGIGRCFFSSGYSALDGAALLESSGVSLHFVDVEGHDHGTDVTPR